METMARNVRAYGSVEAPLESDKPAGEAGDYAVEEDEQWRTVRF